MLTRCRARNAHRAWIHDRPRAGPPGRRARPAIRHVSRGTESRAVGRIDDAASAGVVSGTGAALARNASELGERETELRMIQTELNMLPSFDNFDRSTRGYDTSQSLMTVVRSLAEYPGRKTIVFFSEGLPVSPSLSRNS